jgi:futalosine hydrolase
MSPSILIVAATREEAEVVNRIADTKAGSGTMSFMGKELNVLVTGVGSVATAWSMTKMISSGVRPDIAINIGIAGSFREEIRIGSVVLPVSDCFADAGIDSGKGFLTLSEAGLQDPQRFPFSKGRLNADNRYVNMISGAFPAVNAITVNTASGSDDRIRNLEAKFNPDIETMEGAAFFYVCKMEGIPFIALRGISNRVEIRNKDNWDINLALKSLSEGLKETLILIDK